MTKDIRPDDRAQVPRTNRKPRVIFGIFELDGMFVVLANQDLISRWIARWILLSLVLATAIAKFGPLG